VSCVICNVTGKERYHLQRDSVLHFMNNLETVFILADLLTSVVELL